MKYYAGIGARETPTELRPQMHIIAQDLERRGYILRSGGSIGADTFFEEKVTAKDIFLPWKNFEGNKSPIYGVNEAALNMASKHHPNFEKLSTPAKALIARNCYQILGSELDTPVDFVVCWTKNSKAIGGTGFTIKLAQSLKIPVFNLHNPYWAIHLDNFLLNKKLKQLIEAKELRVGNWISKDGEIFQASGYTILGVEHGDFQVDAIPLTEEWLVKFGFEFNGGMGYKNPHNDEHWYFSTDAGFRPNALNHRRTVKSDGWVFAKLPLQILQIKHKC